MEWGCALRMQVGSEIEDCVLEECLGFVASKHIEHKLIAHKAKRSIKRYI